MAHGRTVSRRRWRREFSVECDIPDGASDEDANDVISALSAYINNDDRRSKDPRVRSEETLLDTQVDQDRDAYKAGKEFAKRSDKPVYRLTEEQRELARRIIRMGVEYLYDKLIPKLLERIGTGMYQLYLP